MRWKGGAALKDRNQKFEEIYSRYYDTVFRFVLSLCGEEAWAEDITEEAFLKALKQIDTFRGECKLSVWLCQIAKNQFYTEAKKQQRQGPYPVDVVTTLTAEEESPEELLVGRETALALHKLLHQLPEPYKEVFYLRTFGELSFGEIGSLFGKSESWARVTYHRAKIKMREALR